MDNKNTVIWKMAGNGLILQLVFLLITLGNVFTTVKASGLKLIKDLALLQLAAGIILCIALLVSGLVYRRALFIHVFFSLWTVFFVSPFLIAVYELSSKNTMLIVFSIAASCAYIFTTYKSKLNILKSKDSPAIKSGRLDVTTRFWDLHKHVIIDSSKNTNDQLAKVILSLGPALGILLYRSFPGQNSPIFTSIFLFMAITLNELTGLHLAISRYIVLTEKKLEYHIHV